MTNKGLRAAAACLALAVTAAHADVSREDIVVLGGDGHTFTSYKTLRSDLPRRQLLLADGTTPEDYLYIYPGDFQRQAVDAGTRLNFSGGDYTVIRSGRLDDSRLTDKGDGRFTFHSWDGETLENGHFGKWNAPDPFATFAYIWIVPDNIRILDYQANRDGEWQRTGNALTWSGHDVNDLTFTVTYRKAASAQQAPAPASSTSTATDRDEDERITLDSAVLFAPGNHELTDKGLSRLDKLAERIAARQPERVIVSGHTDNQPLKPYLRDTYPSNWELSAARATNVIRKLTERGIDPAIFEARALGSQQPVASNETATGRAKNRRIEVILVDGKQAKPDKSASSSPD